jgi:hypothetical protein
MTWQASTSDKVAGAALSVDPKGVLLLPHYSSDLDSSDNGFLHIFSGRAIFLIRFVLHVYKRSYTNEAAPQYHRDYSRLHRSASQQYQPCWTVDHGSAIGSSGL